MSCFTLIFTIYILSQPAFLFDIQQLINSNQYQEALNLILQTLQTQVEAKIRIVLYFYIVDIQIRLENYEQAKKNIEIISHLQLNNYQLFQFFYYVAVVQISQHHPDINAALSDLQDSYERLIQEITFTRKQNTINQFEAQNKLNYINTKMAEVYFVQSLHVQDAKIQESIYKQIDVYDKQANNVMLSQIIQLNKMIQQKNYDLQLFGDICQLFIKNNPENPVNNNILFNYLLILLKHQKFQQFDQIMSLADDVDDPEQSFAFLKLLKEYIINQLSNNSVMQFMAMNPGHPFMDQLTRMEEILRFNQFNMNSSQISQSRVENVSEFTFTDLQILQNMKAFKYAEALKQLDMLLVNMEQSGKSDPSILNLAGIVFLFQNKLKQAQKIFKQILQQKPYDQAVISNYACVLQRLNETQKAILLYQRLMSAGSGPVQENAKVQLCKLYKQLDVEENNTELRKHYQQRWKQLSQL